MVAGAHFLAGPADEAALLAWLSRRYAVEIHPWAPLPRDPQPINWAATRPGDTLAVHAAALGPLRLIRPEPEGFDTSTRDGAWAEIAWHRLEPGPGLGLIDPESSPVLMWRRAEAGADVLCDSEIGTQAASMETVGRDYLTWANSVMAWVRRNGTAVWGLKTQAVRPDLDVQFPHVSTVYALPEARARLESGVWRARSRPHQ